MKHELPKLSYGYDALEPHIDAQTMEIHYTKHHQAYIDKLNGVLEKCPDLQNTPVDDLLRNLQALQIDEADKVVIKNHGGGHSNHSLFWQIMGPNAGGEPSGNISNAIKDSFGDFYKFKEEFMNVAMTIFGSGWAWLVIKDNKLEVTKTPNQDSPLVEGKTPILGIDMWEHAFYLLRQNRKSEYVDAFWNVVNWNQVNENRESAK